MSSLAEAGISFSVHSDEQSFRLLELPTPLLALLASEHPPILHLKSAPTNSASSNSSAPTAVVCTHDQTFEVRQVQSSNILYVLQPSLEASDTENDGLGVSGLTAIGRCKALLELVPISTSPTTFLKGAIPVYNSPQNFPPAHRNLDRYKSKCEWLADSPFSTSEFEKAWAELCVFEIGNQAWRPSASLLRNVWVSFLTLATTKSIDLTESFQVGELASMMKEDGHLEVVLVSLLRRLSSDDVDVIEGWIHIGSAKCVPWLGEVLLTTLCYKGSISSIDFMKAWQDGLPERWRDSASLILIKELFTDLGGGLITLKNAKIPVDDRPSIQTHTTTTVKGPSKWHTKFQASRK